MTITIMMIFVIFRNGQQVDEILLPFLVVPLRCATNEHLKWSSPDSVRGMRGFTTSLPLSLCLSHLLSLRQAFLLLRSTRILSHFDIFLWHATAGTVRCPQVRIVQANRHIWCQLEREEDARRRPFYFPQPPHYRHVVSSIAHWPSPLWRRKWKVTRNFLGNSRLRRFTINCWQFRLIVHHAWLSVNCHCLALSLCLSISISLSSKTCTNAR